ncbi:MAG: serine hydrolase [Cyclobacteriaceae bacterium]|nr:serine hydrolase [Cyclobacteriaceae bacterium]
MKKIFFPALLFLLTQSCSKENQVTVSENIIKVETGLSGSVYFEGDTTWTIEERMKHYDVPGLSIAVINDHKIEWIKSYGIMNKESKEVVTTTTLFQAGSISKPVAAYGALHLADQKKIDLDENINIYLKSWKLADNEFTTEKKVALKNLLSHNAGVTVHGFWGYSPDLKVPTLIQVLNGEPPANSPKIFVDKLPGKSFRYSGGGYCIIQQTMIDVEGKTFPQILKETVLQPLGMENSTYDQPLEGTQLEKAATGYLPDGNMTKGKRHTYPEMAAAGLWTTAEDLAKFALDVQNSSAGKSNAVLSAEMSNLMLTPFVEEYTGLGIFLDNRKGDIYFGHSGWDEGFSSEMKAHKNKGYGVVVLINSNHPEFIEELINSVARTYQWSNFMSINTRVKMDTMKFASIRGRYFNGNDGVIRIFNKGSRLFIKYLRADKPYELFQVSEGTYLSRDQSHPVLPVQFKENPEDGKLNLVFVEKGKSLLYIHHSLNEDSKVPYEYLLEGNFEESLKGYQQLIKTDPKDVAVSEEHINQQGYNLLEAGKNNLAKDVFRINTLLYPSSANTYDSYADACMKGGDKATAITYYQKALTLNPENLKTSEKLEQAKKALK